MSESKTKKLLSVDEFLALPNFSEDKTIYNFIRATKNVDGNPVEGFIKIWLDGADLKKELVEGGRALYTTAMREEDLKIDRDALTAQQVFDVIEARLRKLLYLTDIQYDLLDLCIMSSYFREVFETYPYLDFVSPTNGCGKTNALMCTIWSCFNGVVTSSISEAVIFRFIEDTKGAIGIDELDHKFEKKSENMDILSLLDSGHTKGIMAMRMDMSGDKPKIVTYDPFSLKAWTRIKAIPHSLVTRAIRIPMLMCKEFKPKGVIQPETFKDIRGMLYILRLLKSKEVEELYHKALETDMGLNNRPRDLFLPLLTIAVLMGNIPLFRRVLEYAKGESVEKERAESGDWNPILCRLLEPFVGATPTVFSLARLLTEALHLMGELKDDRAVHGRAVAGMLEGMGFPRATSEHGYARFSITKEQFEKVKTSLGVAIEEKPTLESLLGEEPTHTP